jgi:hypothetical protein
MEYASEPSRPYCLDVVNRPTFSGKKYKNETSLWQNRLITEVRTFSLGLIG